MTTQKKTNKKFLPILLITIAVILAAIFLIPAEPNAEQAVAETEKIEVPATVAPVEEDGRVIRDAFRVRQIRNYTGIYVEDGTDEAVADLLMLEITNISSEPVQYAVFEMDLGDEIARFSVSALPAGGTAMLIEQNRMVFDETVDYAAASLECVNLAGFDAPLSLQEDKLQIQLLDGAANILNISDAEIKGTIQICYKNVVDGIYHGGIAYRIKIEGGMKAGELKQIMATHLYKFGSEIIFVNIVE